MAFGALSHTWSETSQPAGPVLLGAVCLWNAYVFMLCAVLLEKGWGALWMVGIIVSVSYHVFRYEYDTTRSIRYYAQPTPLVFLDVANIDLNPQCGLSGRGMKCLMPGANNLPLQSHTIPLGCCIVRPTYSDRAESAPIDLVNAVAAVAISTARTVSSSRHLVFFQAQCMCHTAEKSAAVCCCSQNSSVSKCWCCQLHVFVEFRFFSKYVSASCTSI